MTDETVTILPDGSAYAVMTSPLPPGHWLTAAGDSVPPMVMRMGTSDPRRADMKTKVSAAARYAIRATTANGTVMDFSPDAMVLNFVVAMLGYYTPDGYSVCDPDMNPPRDT